MFLYDIPVAGIARQGSKSVQLRLSQSAWPATDKNAPLFLLTHGKGATQGMTITGWTNLGMDVEFTECGEWECGDAQCDYTAKRRDLLKAQNDNDWVSVAPIWTVLTIDEPLPVDVEEDKLLVIHTDKGGRYSFLVGAYKAGEDKVTVKADLVDFDTPYQAFLNFQPVNVIGTFIDGYSLITLNLSEPLSEELTCRDTAAIYFNDKAAGQEPETDNPLTIFPYLTVRHNGLIYARDKVDISAGGNGVFDGMGSFRTHIIQSIGLLSIFYNRYRMDSTLAGYVYQSILTMAKTVPQFFQQSDLASIPTQQYPAPYLYSTDCKSFPAREEVYQFKVEKVHAANGEIILPDPTISRIIQITRSDPGTVDLHLRRADAVDIKSIFLSGGQTTYGPTASPYPTSVFRGVILADPLDEEDLFMVYTVCGSEQPGEESFPLTYSDQYDSNNALSHKSIKWNNDGRSYQYASPFTPYWTFPYLTGKQVNGFAGISPDDATLALFFGLYLQESDDATLKDLGNTFINLSLPWLTETWKLTRLVVNTNTDFGLYSTTQFTTFEIPAGTPEQLLTVQTVNGPYHTYISGPETIYQMTDFIASDFLTPQSLIKGFSTIGSGEEVVGKKYPALRLKFASEGYAVFTYNNKKAPLISLKATGYCRFILTDTEGWRYAAQMDNQHLVGWDTSVMNPDQFQKLYEKAPPLGTYPFVTAEIHGNNSEVVLAWLDPLTMDEAAFKGGEIYEFTTSSPNYQLVLNALVDMGQPYSGAFSYFIGENGYNPFIPSTNTPFRGPLSVVQQSPLVYALQNDIGSATACIRLVKDAQEFYLVNARTLDEWWDGQQDRRPAPFLTGVAPTYAYVPDDTQWMNNGQAGFSWLSPVENWADAKTTYRMYFGLSLYWRQCVLQSTDYPNELVDVLDRMVGGIQYMYEVVYAVGPYAYELTKAGIAVSGDWPSYMRAIQQGDNRLFWCGFGQQGPCVGHNLGAVCYALASMILCYQSGMKDQKVFDFINRLINTLFSYSGQAWWQKNTEQTDPLLTTNWTDGAYTNTPRLEDFYILNGEDYGILMFVLGLIDQYFTDIDTQDAFVARYPVDQTHGSWKPTYDGHTDWD